MKTCQINTCNNEILAKQLCETHYHKNYRAINIEKIKLEKKKYYKQNREMFSEKQRTYRKENSVQIKDATRTNRCRFVKLKSKSKQRGLQVTIEFNEFEALMNLNCYYCDGKLGKSVTGSGLDRINNLRGYDRDNVITCCGICNTTRNNKFTVQETKEMITAVLKFRGVK